jgi:hypothetical protein
MTEAAVVFVNEIFVSSFRFVLYNHGLFHPPLPPAGEGSPLHHSQRKERLREG